MVFGVGQRNRFFSLASVSVKKKEHAGRWWSGWRLHVCPGATSFVFAEEIPAFSYCASERVAAVVGLLRASHFMGAVVFLRWHISFCERLTASRMAVHGGGGKFARPF